MCVINTTAQMRTQRRMQTHVAGRTPRVAPGWRHLDLPTPYPLSGEGGRIGTSS